MSHRRATRVVADAARWDVVRRSGPLDADLLRDRPVEERDRPWWSLTWAAPVAGQPVPPTVHAPTPTDEPLDLPALLIASFPLDPGRRHVAPGPLTDFLVARAAEAYAELAVAGRRPARPRARTRRGRARSTVPCAPRRSARSVARRCCARRRASGCTRGDAVVVVGRRRRRTRGAGRRAAGPGRRPPRAGPARRTAAADGRGRRPARRASTGEPQWWHGLYAALADRGASGLLESLGALPVPLADGRTTRGPRGLLLPGDGGLPDGPRTARAAGRAPRGGPPAAAAAGRRRGDRRASCSTSPRCAPRSRTPGTTSRRPRWPTPCSRWSQRAGTRPGELPWLGELPLPDDGGELAAGPRARAARLAARPRRRPGGGRPSGAGAARPLGARRARRRRRAGRPLGAARRGRAARPGCRRRRARPRRRVRLGAGAARAAAARRARRRRAGAARGARPRPGARRRLGRRAGRRWRATGSCGGRSSNRPCGARRRPAGGRAVVHRLVAAGERAAGRPAPDGVRRAGRA